MRRMTALALLLGLGACAATPAASPQAAGGPPSFVVFFVNWSAGLGDSANNVIRAAARAAAANPAASVHVVGVASTLGSPQANIYLSQTRSQVVADALVQDGVAASRITQDARGSVKGLGGDLESRRVTITIGG